MNESGEKRKRGRPPRLLKSPMPTSVPLQPSTAIKRPNRQGTTSNLSLSTFNLETSTTSTEKSMSSEPKKRGRKPKTSSEVTSKSSVAKKTPIYHYVDETDDEEVETGDDDDDDEEFRPDKLKMHELEDDEEEEESNSIEEEEDEDLKTSRRQGKKTKLKESIVDSGEVKKKYNTRGRPKKEKENMEELIDKDDNSENQEPELDKFDMELKIVEWEYELDGETKLFQKPRIPRLSDTAVKPFLDPLVKSAKLTIFKCPFCQRIYTYPLPFKSHLYTCEKNENVPDFHLRCIKFPICLFKSRKKPDMISHFNKIHRKENNRDLAVCDTSGGLGTNHDDDDNDDNIDSFDEQEEKLMNSKTKQRQLKICQYFYVCKNEYKFTFGYLQEMLAKRYLNLTTFDKFYNKFKQFYLHEVIIDLNHLKSDTSNNLAFQLKSGENFHLRPFEMHEHSIEGGDNFKLINMVQPVTAMDWCPMKYNRKPQSMSAQYLAFATQPIQFNDSSTTLDSSITNTQAVKLYSAPNLIHVLKLKNLNNGSSTVENDYSSSFAIRNKSIGCVHGLKWRPDYGASRALLGDDFLGYLLATGTDGTAYVYSVYDLTNHPKFQHVEFGKKLNVFEPKHSIILKQLFTSAQCTCADWCQLNGATQICIGYANGSFATFCFDARSLANQSLSSNNNNDSDFLIYPTRTIQAHYTPVKMVKWSKLNECVLVSGSLFGREIKLWNVSSSERQPVVFDYECFSTDCEFSLHSNDLFITKEANLKGDNRMCALDLAFGFSGGSKRDRDESRAHMSLFYTYATMTALHQSDYLNKLLICDNDGAVILSRANDTKYWIQKNRLMNYSFARIVKFSTTEEQKKENDILINKTYNQKHLQTKKSKSFITINLDRKHNFKSSAPEINSIPVDLNSLNKIKWNENIGYQNWYACSSLSGFIFLHQMNEFKIDPDQLI